MADRVYSVRSGGVRGEPELWCARADGGRSAYADHIATVCGYVVTLPTGIDRRAPTCPECRAKLKETRRGRS